jgi:uncharacterized protein YigA (DUF484 family)
LSDVLRADQHESARNQAIRAFLRSRPDFLQGDPELMRALGVKPASSNVIDFGPAALTRVAQAHKRETHVRRRLELVARANFDAQSKVHDAVIELIGARSHSDLARRLDELARRRLGLVSCVIGLEGPERVPAGWHAMAPGQCELILGQDSDARLGVLPTAFGLFLASPEPVASVALIRLTLWSPARAGVLAFGAGADDAFSPDMGHELIDFLARVVERTAERWPVM